MRKLMYTALVALFTLALTACGGEEEASKKESENQSKQEQSKQPSKEEQAKKMEEMKKKMEKQQVKEDKVVAQVNDKKIVGVDYNRALTQYQMQFQQMGQDPTSGKVAKQIKEQVVKSLVDYEIILQEADKKGYKAPEPEINKQLEQIKGQYKDKKKFEEILKTNKLTEEDLKKQIAENIKYTKYVEKEIPVETVTEGQMQEYYNKMSESQGEKAPKYEEVKAQIKTQLENQQKQKKVTEKVKMLKTNAKVKVNI